jgi:hypothetical protein
MNLPASLHTTGAHQTCNLAPVFHKFEHYANPMVHPVTGETISSYKKLMNDPATAEVWQTAFSKDFGGMAQGDNKTGQKGTEAMFVMSHNAIKHVLKEGKIFTYCNPVVGHRPQKEDPNRIRLTAGGNFIQCDKELSVPTAGLLETAKLHWNSIVSTAMAKYMCIDLKNFYPTAKLEFYEYRTIPSRISHRGLSTNTTELTCIEWYGIPGIAASSLGITAGGHPCQ